MQNIGKGKGHSHVGSLDDLTTCVRVCSHMEHKSEFSCVCLSRSPCSGSFISLCCCPLSPMLLFLSPYPPIPLLSLLPYVYLLCLRLITLDLRPYLACKKYEIFLFCHCISEAFKWNHILPMRSIVKSLCHSSRCES